MGQCNEKRKLVQEGIVTGARESVQWYAEDPILFLGGDWHQGVVGIAASKIAEDSNNADGLFQTRSYVRTFSLPSPVSEEKVDAKYNDGILTVALQKTSPSGARLISVK